MSRVRIQNTSNTNIGFSFGFLFRGQQTLVEEARLSVGDRRMIASKNLPMEPEVVVAVAPKEKAERTTLDGPKNEGAPEKAIANVTVADMGPQKVAAVVVDAGPVLAAPAPAAETKPEAPPKPKLTKEQLEAMTKTELKKLSEGLGADGRSRANMIAKIMESQEK